MSSLWLQREQRSTRTCRGRWLWSKTPSSRWTPRSICTRRAVDWGTSTARWSQRRRAKSKTAECFAGRTWRRAAVGCCTMAWSTGKLHPADSKVIQHSQLLLNFPSVVSQEWTLITFTMFLLSDILAVLLSDVLLLLQEKDQRYLFAAVVRDLTLWTLPHNKCVPCRNVCLNSFTVAVGILSMNFFLSLLLFPRSYLDSPGQQAIGDLSSEADCQGGGPRGESYVPHLRLLQRAGNVQDPHQLQGGAKQLDDSHSASSGEVPEFGQIRFTFVLKQNLHRSSYLYSPFCPCR